MKGFAKVMKRTPHIVTSKVGLAAKSTDVEFDHLKRKFEAMERLAHQLTKEATTYLEAAKKMLSSSQLYAQEFSALFHPFGTEYDLERRHPEAVQTLVNLTGYVTYVDDLREALRPEMELIASRVIAPAQELEVMMKGVSKAITKRDHKLIDFDRHNNSYTKLKDKQNRSAKDDQAMFKLEHDCEAAAADYEHHNNLLKSELPRFLDMATRLVTPLFYSFYYMQLNIFYTSMERLQTYAQGKFDLSENNLIAHEHKYALSLQNVVTQLEGLSIQKPTPPSARILQMAKSGQSLSSLPPMKSAAGYPTEPLSSSKPAPAAVGAAPAPAPPPAYPGGAAPAEKAADYVVALYDYTATAAGDLTFKTGDRIEVVERTASTEDWWTGRLNGMQGVFPGNYVRNA
ncbi:BAR adaptor protein Hob1 [Malassezia japonica]|uniref:BAR adaptor protein Hob1 n=1 Tax=Malassezia japonica TaxID=223818 RepID=A0AAF0JBC3_9BASI|nr:BAR adaptor protein Hob1 [Malassezia japonica]WFD40737.1 BAR adaptor protein Hob1 [Malassezia japonica]